MARIYEFGDLKVQYEQMDRGYPYARDKLDGEIKSIGCPHRNMRYDNNGQYNYPFDLG